MRTHFYDVDKNRLEKFIVYLKKNTKIIKNKCINIKTGRHIRLIVTHVNGLSCEIDKII